MSNANRENLEAGIAGSILHHRDTFGLEADEVETSDLQRLLRAIAETPADDFKRFPLDAIYRRAECTDDEIRHFELQRIQPGARPRDRAEINVSLLREIAKKERTQGLLSKALDVGDHDRARSILGSAPKTDTPKPPTVRRWRPFPLATLPECVRGFGARVERGRRVNERGIIDVRGDAVAEPLAVLPVRARVRVRDVRVAALRRRVHARDAVDHRRRRLGELQDAPRALAPNADEGAKKRFEADTKRFEEAMAKWTPEVDAAAKASQEQFNREAAASLVKLAPAELEAKKIDGVIFANTTGDLPIPDKEGFLNWIKAGGAFIGMHSCSDTFHGWPEFIDMLGGEFRTHGAQAGVECMNVDPAHPSTQKIGKI
jgi:hypothetical protein